jgi:WD40 repeat protein
MFASGCGNPTLRVWKLDNAEPEAWAALANENAPALGIASVGFSHDGKLLVAATHAGKQGLRVWDVAGNYMEERDVPPTRARLVACSPTAPLAALGGDDGRVRMWDLGAARPKETAALTAHDGAVKALAFGPTGTTLVSAGQDRKVVWWDVARRAQVRAWPWPDEPRALAVAGDGRHLAVGTEDGSIYLLRLAPATMKE